MKYSKSFERDYIWYLKYKDVFNFDGTLEYINKNNQSIFIEDENGLTAKECFYRYDSTGKIHSCKEIQLYRELQKCKGSINFHIKQWAEDRLKGYLGWEEFETIIKEFELLDWMIKAVEHQKHKLHSEGVV